MAEFFDLDAVLDAVAGGNSAAFMQVVHAYGLVVRSYLGSQIWNAADVDDLAQDTFIAAFRTLHTFRRGDDFAAWLRGIARNKGLMYFRGAQRRVNALEKFRAEIAVIVDEELDSQSSGDRQEQIAALLRCISKLPEKLRRIVHSGLDGVKAAAVAQSFQTSTAAVYQLHYRANQLLRDCMTREVQDV
ncbi:MAG: hypothetical protein RLZZ399_1448 [Verrucomicrobiota bacterium]|jgi:RNA polymerase sigma-70 factor (ECF subfamily)